MTYCPGPGITCRKVALKRNADSFKLSSPTARDRYRLRQQQLENLDWRFLRIWSTDWFMRKDEDMVEELVPELCFSRRGPRIEATLRYLLDCVKKRGKGQNESA